MFLRHGLLAPLAAASLLCLAAAPAAHADTATANLHITMEDSYPAIGVSPGSSARVGYHIVATNDGPDAALATIRHGVVLLTAWNCTATGGAVCPAASGGSHIDHAIVMPAGARVEYRVEAGMVPVQSAVRSSATISGDVHDDALDDNTAVTVTPVFHPNEVDLAVTVQADRASAMPGDVIGYTIVAHNPGAVATYASVDVLNSAYLVNPQWTCTGDAGATCNSQSFYNGTLTQNLHLPPGASATLVVTAALGASAANAGAETFVQRAWIYGAGSNDLAIADNAAEAIGHVSLFQGTFDD